MKITVIGVGYVGLVAGVGFADFGNDIIFYDINYKKIRSLEAGRCPIYEPGIEEVLERNKAAGRISFSTDIAIAIKKSEIIFIAVDTPESETGEAYMDNVFEVSKNIAENMNEYKLIVNKSTSPVGTVNKMKKIIKETLNNRNVTIDFDVASNPEFLREGKAISDFLNPDRIVIGVNNDKSMEILKGVYKIFARSNKPLIVTSPETAEMIKYASNAFLATKITFINEIANLCEKVGADVLEVASAMGKDGRISPKFLHPGPGYGGSCFPKDTKALAAIGIENNCPMTIIETVINANKRQKEIALRKIIEKMEPGKTIALLGLAFKPDTDDIRESSGIYILKELLKSSNYIIKAYDPQAMENAKTEIVNDSVIWCDNFKNTLINSDCLVIMTEWREFRSIDLDEIKKLMNGNIIFDFRNIFSKAEMLSKGFDYYGIGV